MISIRKGKFMDRRRFVSGTAAGFLVSHSVEGAITPDSGSGSAMLRSSTVLGDSTGKAGVNLNCVVPFLNSQIAALYYDQNTKVSGVVLSDSRGLVAAYQLPRGRYSGLGQRGQNIVVGSIYYFRGVTDVVQNGVLELEPSTGKISSIGSAGSGAQSSLHHAGDSRLVRLGIGYLDVWDLKGNYPSLVQTISIPEMNTVERHVDLLSPATISLVRYDAISITIADIEASSYSIQNIAHPDISSARAQYATMFERNGIDPSRTKATIFTATGTGADGALLAVLSPAKDGETGVYKFDKLGQCVMQSKILLPKRSLGKFGIQRKIVSIGNQTGLVFGDGNVAWYGF